MTALRDRVATVFGVAIGAMWLVAASAKIAAPLGAYYLVARATPEGVPPKIVLASAVAAETALGAAMLLRGVRGLGWSLAALAAASAVILVVRGQMGGFALCGCFGSLAGTTLDGALVRVGILAALHVAIMLWLRRPRTSRAVRTSASC